jgi:broad specificity phosphatase PhoE
MITNNTCEIVVVRHGQTIANKEGILQGQIDTQLDEVGLLQAKAVAQRLKNQHFDLVYSSDLSRTMVTAQEIVKFHQGLEVIPTPYLREWHLGIFQGQKLADLKSSNPDFLTALKKDGSNANIPEGENVEEFHKRIVTFLDDIANKHLGKRILLVSHGGSIGRMLIHVFGPLSSTNTRPLCDNVSISSFRYTPGHWQLVSWNDTAHLENLELTQTIAL